MPEVGLLLVPPAADGMPLALPAVAARVRVAMGGPPGGFGSLLGEVVLAAPEEAALAVVLVVTTLSLLLVLPFLRTLLRPAVGCLSDRGRWSAEAEEDDDMSPSQGQMPEDNVRVPPSW
jgi:hypothetical protein